MVERLEVAPEEFAGDIECLARDSVTPSARLRLRDPR